MSSLVGKKIMSHLLLLVSSVSRWIKSYQIVLFPQMSWESCSDRDLLRESEWWGWVVAGGLVIFVSCWRRTVSSQLLTVSCWEWVVHGGVLLRESCFWEVVVEREGVVVIWLRLLVSNVLHRSPNTLNMLSASSRHSLGILQTWYCQQALNMLQLALRHALNRPSCYSQHALITALNSSQHVFQFLP